MNLRKLTMLLSILALTGSLFAQYGVNYEFLGKVSPQGGMSKGVEIKVFEGDSCFSNYTTRSNGKFAFYGEGDKYFILQFKKEGYFTKQLIVNTKGVKISDTDMDKLKFDINLQKLNDGDQEDQYITVIDVIELNNLGNKFRYRVNRDKNEYFAQKEQMASK
jgi:hypothetical protein